jgi:hypothetical protein
VNDNSCGLSDSAVREYSIDISKMDIDETMLDRKGDIVSERDSPRMIRTPQTHLEPTT